MSCEEGMRQMQSDE